MINRNRLRPHHLLMLCATAMLGLTTGTSRAAEADQTAYGAIACEPEGNATEARGCGWALAVDVTQQDPKKILLGREVAPGKYPWVVAIARQASNGKLRPFCGGSVVGTKWVLTAAHCIVKKGDFVIVNRVNLAKTKEGKAIQVDRVEPSKPKYDKPTKAYDVMLVHLKEAVDIEPIPLSEDAAIEEKANTELIIAGWGTTSYLGRPSDVLLETKVSTRDLGGCQSIYEREKRTLAATSFCAMGTPDKRVDADTGVTVPDSCQGDSGGPAFRRNDLTGKYQLVGVVSWGIGCGNDALPGVYTRSSAITAWLKPVVKKS